MTSKLTRCDKTITRHSEALAEKSHKLPKVNEILRFARVCSCGARTTLR